MFRIFWFVAILFNLFCVPKSIIAKSVGLFDPYFTLLFHPRMANFDFGMQRFLKESPQSNTLDWLEERKNVLNEYQVNRQTIKTQQTIAMRNFYADILSLREQGIFGSDLDQRIPKLHTKHFGQIDTGESEINKFYESDYRCLEIYKNMFKELSDILKKVQKDRDLFFIIPVQKHKIQIGIKSFSHTFQFDLSGVNNYWKLYDVLQNDGTNFNSKESLIRLNDYLHETNEYQSLFYPKLSNALIVRGEEDITALMLEKLYENYAQKIAHAKIIGELYKLWKNSKF